MTLSIPSIHMNGTSKNELLEQLQTAYSAVDAAMLALANATPNGRDYYPQGPDAIRKAIIEHGERLAKLTTISKELETIALAIVDGGS